MNKNKIIREPADMKAVKRAEIENKKEEIEELEKDLETFKELKTQTEEELIEKDNARAEEDLKENENMPDTKGKTQGEDKQTFDKIKKLKCNYEIFRTERNKAKMRVPEKCEICQNTFKDNDTIYVALGKKLNQIFICEECAEDNQQKNT